MPVRIQRKRTKGWRMPENTMAVTRGTSWGNPFKVGGWFAINHMGMSWVSCAPSYQTPAYTFIETREQAIQMYREYIGKHPLKNLDLLRGKNLACFCPLDQPCHADVLLEIANPKTTEQGEEAER